MEKEQMSFWTDLPLIETSEQDIGLFNIPSDDNSGFVLGLYMHHGASGDIFIKMTNKISFQSLDSIRLRSFSGGGFNPFITGGFVSILAYFRRGMFEQDNESRFRERLSPASKITVERGQGNKPKLSIIGIQDDDGDLDFIDIHVLQGGDVELEIRNQTGIEDDEKVRRGKMVFKTTEHGGQNPYIAKSLARIAEQIAKSS